jgi:hypothetical protein
MSSLKAHKPSPQREQSSKQVWIVSRPVQRRSPQTLQSPGQVLEDSLGWQMRSPQREQSEGHVSLGSHVLLQTPRQSARQLPRVSPPSHTPLPHTFATKQSSGQESAVSVSSHRPLPHEAQSMAAHESFTSQTPSQLAAMQSIGQLRTLSDELQTPSPQVVAAAQSRGQVRMLSKEPHTPSPQLAVVEQSRGQLLVVSLSSQSPSPQVARQSTLQLWPPSSRLHTASPQKQSEGHAATVSLGSQMALPHSAGSIGFSPRGARPQAPTTPAPARNNAPQRTNPHATRALDTTERVLGMPAH